MSVVNEYVTITRQGDKFTYEHSLVQKKPITFSLTDLCSAAQMLQSTTDRTAKGLFFVYRALENMSTTGDVSATKIEELAAVLGFVIEGMTEGADANYEIFQIIESMAAGEDLQQTNDEAAGEIDRFIAELKEEKERLSPAEFRRVIDEVYAVFGAASADAGPELTKAA